MKKLDGVFDSMTEFSHLYQSFHSAAEGKRMRSNVTRYKINLEENLFELQEKLRDGSYEFGPYRGFYVHEPKTRYIESAYFENRIVHHAIHSRLEPWIDTTFYAHSYACRSGRGTHRAMLTLKGWLKNRRLQYYLKCDIKKFFPSIDREVMVSLLGKKIADARLMNLLEKLIFSAPGEVGIPIWNLTSQILANFYMNELDQFVKRQLRVKHYIRYMDDFVLLFEDEKTMKQTHEQIETFLVNYLKLKLSPQKSRLDKTKNGISFVGYLIKGDKVRLRNAAYRRIKKKVALALDKSQLKIPIDLTAQEVKRSKFYASYSSFKGQAALTSYAEVLNKMLLKEMNIKQD